MRLWPQLEIDPITAPGAARRRGGDAREITIVEAARSAGASVWALATGRSWAGIIERRFCRLRLGQVGVWIRRHVTR